MHLSYKFLWYRVAPFLMCFALILLNAVPFHWLPNYPYSFQWILVPIFYYAVYYPQLLSSWAVFILAVIADLLVARPFGVLPFSYILMFFIPNLLRKYLIELTFWQLWGVFAGFLLVIELLSFGIVYILATHPVAFYPIVIEFWGICLSYPFFIRFCAHLDRKVRETA